MAPFALTRHRSHLRSSLKSETKRDKRNTHREIERERGIGREKRERERGRDREGKKRKEVYDIAAATVIGYRFNAKLRNTIDGRRNEKTKATAVVCTTV